MVVLGIILGVFALIQITMLLLDLGTGWNGETYISRNDVVFEGRNQSYGAYELRKNYNQRVMFIIAGVIGFAFGITSDAGIEPGDLASGAPDCIAAVSTPSP